MAMFQVRYLFESNSRDKTGEQVIENVEAETPEQVAKDIQEKMREATFLAHPAIGPASGGAGVVVINTALVRYVEVLPGNSGGVQLT